MAERGHDRSVWCDRGRCGRIQRQPASGLEQIEHKSRQSQKILVERVGRFDCLWPEHSVKPFNIAFPAIKPAKNLENDVETLIAQPPENAIALGRASAVSALLEEQAADARLRARPRREGRRQPGGADPLWRSDAPLLFKYGVCGHVD